jgi:opacity protein-like surface antigen
MQNSRIKRLCLGMVLVVAASSAANAKDCDRTCLRDLITTYVDAMVAHRPDSLPLEANGASRRIRRS